MFSLVFSPVRFSLRLRRPVGTRARIAAQKSACLSARYIPRNPARANHRTPLRRAPQAYRFSDSGTQTTSQNVSTRWLEKPPLIVQQDQPVQPPVSGVTFQA